MANSVDRPCGNKQTYIGTQVAICPADRDPVMSDVVGSIITISGLGSTMDVIDTTSVTDTSGYDSKSPSIRRWSPATFTLFTDGENFGRIYNQYFANNPTEDSVFCKLVIVMPKRATWLNKPTPVFTGFISSFTFGDVQLEDAQQFSFDFNICGAPSLFNGFSDITSVTANPTTVDATGGDVVFTIAGTNLIDNIMVKGFVNGIADANTIGFTSGSSTSQSVTIKYPANTGTESKVYTVKVSMDGGNTYATSTATVTVSAPTVA